MENNVTAERSPEMAKLYEWLRSEDKNDPLKGCYPLLREVARSVIRWARGRNGKIRHELRDVLLYDEDSSTTGENNNSSEQKDRFTNADSLTSAVITFIWEFLNNPNRLKDCRVQLSEYYATDNLNGIRAIITDRVINYCRDEARKASNSPFHYCYRRMSTVIGTAAQKPGTNYQYDHKEGQGSYYAITPRLLLKRLLEGKLSIDKFSGWPHPGFSISEIERAVVLLGISDVFWKHSLEVIAQLDELDDPEYLLSIKELVEFIDVMYGLNKPEVLEEVTVSEDGEELPSKADTDVRWQPHDLFDTSARQLPNQNGVISSDLMTNRLEPLAEKMIEKWKPNRRKCYFLYHHLGYTLEKIYPMVGLGSPQAVHSNIKESEEAIRQVAMMKEFDREDKLLFLRAVVNIILKYHPECRDAGEGESLSNG